MGQAVPPEPDSAYAVEGTAAHALAEIKAGLAFGLVPPHAAEAARRAWADEYGIEGDALEAMEAHTGDYVSLLAERLALYPNSALLLEQRMDTGIPTCWGTADTVIVSPAHIEVIDLKYGAGIRVSALGNPQLRLYGLGALDTFADVLGETKEIRITVFQPRLSHLETEILTPDELRKWRESILPVAAEALGDDARFGPSDGACRWCPASGRCRAQLEAVFADEDFEDTAALETLTPEEVAETLGKTKLIRSWLNAFEEAALAMAYSEGKTIPGYKVVLSGGRRTISDSDGAIAALTANGYPKSRIAKTALRGITDLERIMGKAQFEYLLAPFVRKSEGKPSIVPESDRRRAASPNGEAAKDFAEGEEEQ